MEIYPKSKKATTLHPSMLSTQKHDYQEKTLKSSDNFLKGKRMSTKITFNNTTTFMVNFML